MRRLRRVHVGSPCAVIFDLDGTLLDTEPVYRAAFGAALAAFGRRLDGDLYSRLIGIATPDRIPLLAGAFGSTFPVAPFLAEYYRQKRSHIALGITLKSGAVALLDLLRNRGIPVAIATSASWRTARSTLAQAGLLGRFATVVTRDHVARSKPFPDLFLQAAATLKVDPSRCLALEDSPVGLEAARRAGMTPLLVPDLAPVHGHEPVRVVEDLHAVRTMLAETDGTPRAIAALQGCRRLAGR